MSHYVASEDGTFTGEKSALIAAEVTKLDHAGAGINARTLHLSQVPEEAPLHEDFEWRNEVAGVLYRDEQARKMLRSVRLVVEGASGQEHEMRAFQAIRVEPAAKGEAEEDGKVYRPTLMVLAEESSANQVLEDARRQLIGWRNRWKAYADVHSLFERVFTAIEGVIDPAD